MDESIRKRTIPTSNEKLPVIGLGTWQTFGVGKSDEERNPLKDVLKNLVAKALARLQKESAGNRAERQSGRLRIGQSSGE